MHERHKLMKNFLVRPKTQPKQQQQEKQEENHEKHFPSPTRMLVLSSQPNSSFRRFYLLCNFKQAGSGEFSPIKIAFMGGVIFF